MKRLWKKLTGLLKPTWLEVELAPARIAIYVASGAAQRDLLISRELKGYEGGSPSWGVALANLDELFTELAPVTTAARVTLSNRWIRYLSVPRDLNLRTETERREYARHVFVSRFGSEAERWVIRRIEGQTSAHVVCAVDVDLIEALKSVFKKHGIAIHSVEPVAVAACSALACTIAGGSRWLVVTEPNDIFIALLSDGTWTRVSVHRTHGQGGESIVAALNTEHQLQGMESAIGDVTVIGTAGEIDSRPAIEGYRFTWLTWPVVALSPVLPVGGKA